MGPTPVLRIVALQPRRPATANGEVETQHVSPFGSMGVPGTAVLGAAMDVNGERHAWASTSLFAVAVGRRGWEPCT